MNQRPKRKALKSYFPDYMAGAIFSQMTDAPWHGEAALEMDIAYFASYSGDKLATAFVRQLSVDGIANVATIADVLWKLNGQSWTKLYEAFAVDYKPLDNYNITETIARNQVNDGTVARTEDTTSSVNSTVTNNGTTTLTSNQSGSNNTKTDGTEEDTTTVQYGKVDTINSQSDHYIVGFNSEAKTPDSSTTESSTDTQSGTDTTTRNSTTSSTTNGTTTSEGKDITTVAAGETTIGSNTDKTTGNDITNETEKEDITRARQGNIGQTSYQDLIRQELELRKWKFYHQVFEDCDRFLVLSVYDPCFLGSVD